LGTGTFVLAVLCPAVVDAEMLGTGLPPEAVAVLTEETEMLGVEAAALAVAVPGVIAGATRGTGGPADAVAFPAVLAADNAMVGVTVLAVAAPAVIAGAMVTTGVLVLAVARPGVAVIETSTATSTSTNSGSNHDSETRPF